MTIQVLTEGEIDTLFDSKEGFTTFETYSKFARAIESALIAKLAAGELPELPAYDIESPDGFEWSTAAIESYGRLARAQGAASMVPLQKDAARYRKLRDNDLTKLYCDWMDELLSSPETTFPEEFDAAIDAAMESSQ